MSAAKLFNKAGRVTRAVAVAGLAASTALAKPWSFGVIDDTQWAADPAGDTNSKVAVNVIDAVNKQFINAKVDLVLQPGDLTENGTNSPADLGVRAAHNAALTAAGIAFYPVRGNHERSAAAASYFNTAFPDLTKLSTPYADTRGLTYSFVHNNAKFVLLDPFTMNDGKTYSMADYGGWLRAELQAPDHHQAFVLSHKPLLGDSVFGADNADLPTQNAFISTLANNSVRYFISGHYHAHYRSLVASADGQATVQQILGASDSSSFYPPPDFSFYADRNRALAQDPYRVGYYIYTVDGPRVTVDYYASPPFWSPNQVADGKTVSTAQSSWSQPQWQLRETFGYSLNGKEFVVAPGGSLTVVKDASVSGTKAAILAGVNLVAPGTADGRSAYRDVNTGWTDRAEFDADLKSDVLSLWGLTKTMGSGETDAYVLSMSFDPEGINKEWLAAGGVYLAALDQNGEWRRAVDANFGGVPLFVYGAYDGGKGYGLGVYGVSTADSTVWAVLNHDGQFAVIAPVPLPATLALMVQGLGLLSWVARGRHCPTHTV